MMRSDSRRASAGTSAIAAVALALLVATTVSAQEPLDFEPTDTKPVEETPAEDAPEEPAPPGSLRDSTFEVSAMYLWVVGVRKEKEYDLSPGEGEARPDIESGSGIGLRAGLAVSDWVSVGPLYLFSRHDEHEFDRGVDIHALYIEALIGGPLHEGTVQTTMHLGLGAGGYAIDFDHGFEDSGGMAFEARFVLGFQVLEQLQLRASAAYHIVGELDTCANDGGADFQGGFVGFEVAWHF
jgi:hypothetical protein